MVVLLSRTICPDVGHVRNASPRTGSAPSRSELPPPAMRGSSHPIRDDLVHFAVDPPVPMWKAAHGWRHIDCKSPAQDCRSMGPRGMRIALGLAGTRIYASCAMAIVVLVVVPRIASADPPLQSLSRLPVCGDQGDGTARLRCPDFLPIPEIQLFEVPGRGPVDAVFSFVFSEAAVPNELGVFRVDDPNGTIEGLSPVEPGY